MHKCFKSCIDYSKYAKEIKTSFQNSLYERRLA